jgi:nucleoside-diphosphate-sugar epimerase
MRLKFTHRRSPQMALKFIVTGASGFIGRQVCRHLMEYGHDVTGVGRHDCPPNLDHRWISCDLLQPGCTQTLFENRQFDRLIHLAWTVEHGKYWTDLANIDWAAATLNLVRAAQLAGISHVTVSGTCYEYDWPDDADCVEDHTPCAAHTLYDATKDATHRALHAFAQQTGLGLAWVRLFHLYGASEHPNRLIASVAKALVAGVPAKTSSGQAVRDFMDVRDAARAISLISQIGRAGAHNIGSGRSVRIADIVQKLGELAERPELIMLGALPDRPEPPRITADIKRLSLCGFSPTYSLEQGLSDVLNYWRINS